MACIHIQSFYIRVRVSELSWKWSS